MDKIFHNPNTLPNLDETCFKVPQQHLLNLKPASNHLPRILMLYGSLRERSYSKLLTLEAARLLELMGAEVKVFNPSDLPQPDAVSSWYVTSSSKLTWRRSTRSWPLPPSCPPRRRSQRRRGERPPLPPPRAPPPRQRRSSTCRSRRI